MSTTFGVYVQSEEGISCNDVEYPNGKPCVRIAHRSPHGIVFTNPIAHLLPDSLEVIPLDNSAQGINTIGDIKRKIATKARTKEEIKQSIKWYNTLRVDVMIYLRKKYGADTRTQRVTDDEICNIWNNEINKSS